MGTETINTSPQAKARMLSANVAKKSQAIIMTEIENKIKNLQVLIG